MPSIFSRVTLTSGVGHNTSITPTDGAPSPSFEPSTPVKNNVQRQTVGAVPRMPRSQSNTFAADEFGNWRTSGLHESSWLPPHGMSYQDIIKPQVHRHTPATPLPPPKYEFCATQLPVLASSASATSFSSVDTHDRREYGFLRAKGRDVILGLDVVDKVVNILSMELGKRCLTTPMLFSNQALDLNATRTKLLIDSLMKTAAGTGTSRAEATFSDDVRTAREHELAWALRWTLSKVWRVQHGTGITMTGLLDWDAYEDWRAREKAQRYPPSAYQTFVSRLEPRVVSILQPLLNLLSRFAAHSHLSGLTPHALASLFAPLLFGLPVSAPCATTHAHFVRAACATEHLLLAYIRASEGPVDGLGINDLPARLKEWVAGYPSMLASDGDLAVGAPRRGARLLRCERAARTVRAYSKDLIATAEEWAKDGKGPSAAWDTVVLATRRGEESRPLFSQSFRRKIGTSELLPLPTSSLYNLTMGQPIRRARKEHQGENARWGSLADKEWGMFEEGGFGSRDGHGAGEDGEDGDISMKLSFDLTEGAKRGTVQKRATMHWNDFAAPNGGFSRTDPLLSASLNFSPPLQSSIAQWPQERQELHRRLHRSHKDSVRFEYDTTPLWGLQVCPEHDFSVDSKGRAWIEEAFVDAWADLMLGCGLIDRDELTFKEASWVLIGYKARPTHPDPDALDPRTSEQYFIFEETVPKDYQLAILDPKPKSSVSSLFSPRKSKIRAIDPNTVKGIGSKMQDNADFDIAVMRKSTRKLTLEKPEIGWSMPNGSPSPARLTLSQGTIRTITSPTTPPSFSTRHHVASPEGTPSPIGKISFFSSRTMRRNKPVQGTKKSKPSHKAKKADSREAELEFEMRDASGASSGPGSPDTKQRNARLDEKWIDILVAGGARRMETQDIPLRSFQMLGNKAQPVSPRPVLLHAATKEQQDGVLGWPILSPGVSVEEFPPDTTVSTSARVDPPSIHVRTAGENTVIGFQPEYPCASQEDSLIDLSTLNAQEGSDRENGHSPALSDVSSFAENSDALPPTPTPRPRDTIHDVIDSYDLHRQSYESSYAQDDLEVVPDKPGDFIECATKVQDDGQDNTAIFKKPVMSAHDLQPIRVPSPQRYVHGEPLHFVGEEPEREEEEDRRLREEERLQRLARELQT